MNEVYADDINVPISRFNGADKLYVSKIFGVVLQGEGPWTGQPCTFIRLAGCNRGAKTSPAGCAFCDADFRLAQARAMSVEDVAVELGRKFGRVQVELSSNPDHSVTNMNIAKRRVVISGGEPLLQYRMIKRLREHLDALNPNLHTFQVESNGDFVTSAALQPFDTVVISPKTGNIGRWPQHLLQSVRTAVATNRIRPEQIPWFKILVSADPESPYSTLPPWFVDLLSDPLFLDRVYLQPLTVYNGLPDPERPTSFWPGESNIDHAATAANHKAVAALAVRFGLRASGQLHLMFAVE